MVSLGGGLFICQLVWHNSPCWIWLQRGRRGLPAMTSDIPALRREDWEPRRWRNLTRPERAAEEIAALVAGLEPGDRLGTKEEIRAHCGVSVGTFNEALRLVQQRGLVRVKSGPGGGLFVDQQSPLVRLGNSMLAVDHDAASVADAIRLRDALDPLLVEDALKYASAQDIAAMRAELRRMKTAADDCDGTAFIRANWALHARIAEVSPSPILRPLYLNLLEMVESHLLSVQPTGEQPLPEFIQERYELHVALVDAIAAGDVKALDVIAEHNTTSRLSHRAGPA
ncbi:FadR/GntR family transcriptional regulator [Amycolatopsis thermoflava]|uniref:FadR/GntR family transcriptional regulator n=1 Tax=Amycolatopsis thermoflava TaxID=84480 RepID=UPI00381253DD